MRDIIVSLVLLGLLPACFKRPYIGLLVFSWLAYMRVQDLTWGFAKHMRWSFYVMVLTFVGFVRQARGNYFIANYRTYVLIAIMIMGGIGLCLATQADSRHFSRYFEFVKIICIALFTTALVNDKERLRIMLWVIALSFGFYGLKSGVGGVLSGGNMIIKTGPGGMLKDNNDFALALAMSVPMLFHLGWTERRPIIKKTFFFLLPLTVISVALTHSRGGFLSCTMAIGVLIWRSRNRLNGIAVGLVVAILAFALAPESYKERLSTIKDYETEGSASSRLRAWKIATRMATANPFFGVGFGLFPRHFVEFCDDPSPLELQGKGVIVAHSSYLQIWAEFGTPALILYLSLILVSFLDIWKIRKMAARRYYSSWILNYCTLFEGSLVAFTVGATFLNRAHFDLFYQWVGLIICFGVIARREMAQEGKVAANVTKSARQRSPVTTLGAQGFERRRQLPGFRPAMSRER